MVSDDGFWMDAVRKLCSNHAVDGFDALQSLIRSYKLNEHQLRSLASSLRSLEGEARDRASTMEAVRKRPWEYPNEPYPCPIAVGEK